MAVKMHKKPVRFTAIFYSLFTDFVLTKTALSVMLIRNIQKR